MTRIIARTSPARAVQTLIDSGVHPLLARVYAARGKDLGQGNYLMDHSRFAYLMDPDGKPIVILPVDKGPDAVASDLAAAVR